MAKNAPFDPLDPPDQTGGDSASTVSDSPSPGGGHDREALKDLLLREERTRIEQLEQSLDTPEEHTRLISRDLPRAIRERGRQDHALTSALAPAVEEIMQDSVRRDPRTLADLLYPVMGPAIKRSIAEALRAMIQSLNEVLSHSFSWQGLKWRIEAMRSRKSFAEVVLLHSLVFRVEQVFLIHKETGIVLHHVVADDVAFQDADLVSGMLTAIQDFVRDSFTGDEGALDSLQMGDLQVLIQQGGKAVLAGIVRGRPPVELEAVFASALGSVEHEKRPELRDFSGDTSLFDDVRPLLEDCLQARYHKKRESFPYGSAAVFAGAGLLVFGLWYLVHAEAERWQDFLVRLEAEPGIVVVQEDSGFWEHSASGLRDPLAPPLAELLEASGLDPEDVTLSFEPFQAMAPEFVLARAEKALAPPDSVTLTFEDGMLRASGPAAPAWLEAARPLAWSIPGVNEYDDSGLTPDKDALLAMVRQVLQPPDTVELSIVDDVIEATGVAPWTWAQQARTMARGLPRALPSTEWIKGYRDAGMRIDYSEELAMVREVLGAPESVDMELSEGVLSARGTAPWPWLVKARELAPRFALVDVYEDAGLSPDYDDTLARMAEQLSPPDSVTLSFPESDGVLHAAGEARHAWIEALRQALPRFPEITRLEDANLADLDALTVERLTREIEAWEIRFATNKTRPLPGQDKELQFLAGAIRELMGVAEAIGSEARIELFGYADDRGREGYNKELSIKRASNVKDLLLDKGVPPRVLGVRGLGALKDQQPDLPDDERAPWRSVKARVLLHKSDDAPGAEKPMTPSEASEG